MLNEAEKQERLGAVEDVIGTHRAEGIPVDETVLRLMAKFVEGECSLDEFSEAVEKYAEVSLAGYRPMAGAA